MESFDPTVSHRSQGVPRAGHRRTISPRPTPDLQSRPQLLSLQLSESHLLYSPPNTYSIAEPRQSMPLNPISPALNSVHHSQYSSLFGADCKLIENHATFVIVEV